MEFLSKIRLRIGKAILSRKASRMRRKVSYSGFRDVRNMGIVWDASRPSEFASLSRFHQRMEDKKIDLKILGYYPGKNLPDQYTAIRYLTCIRQDEINSFYHPVTPEANSFINNRFDVLIDVNFEKRFPLKYITVLSKAKLKVGLYDNGSSPDSLDMMIELKKPVDIEGFLNNVLKYLEMIRTNP